MARNCNEALQKHVIGVETVDHPTDGQLVAYARTAFAADDALMQPVGVPGRAAQARERAGGVLVVATSVITGASPRMSTSIRSLVVARLPRTISKPPKR